MAIKKTDPKGRLDDISSLNDDKAGSGQGTRAPPVIRTAISSISSSSTSRPSPTGSNELESGTTSLACLQHIPRARSSDDAPEPMPLQTTAGITTASSQKPTIKALTSQPTYASATDSKLAQGDLDEERRRKQKNNAALIAAVKDKGWGEVRNLIHLNVDLNRPDPDGYTALHHAVMLDDMRMARLLLDNGAKKGARTRQGHIALMLAASNRLPHLVELLANHRIGNMLMTTSDYTNRSSSWTPYHENALSISYTEVVDRLEIFAKAVKEGDIVTAARMIAAGSMEMEESDGNGDTPLVIAATSGNAEMIRLLLCNGAKIYSSDRNARSPLICAAANRHFGAIEVLLHAGADPLQADIHGKNALDQAVDVDDADLLNALLGGRNAGGGLYKHMPALVRQAAMACKLASVKMLLAMEADLPDERGCLALAVMAAANELKAVQTLLAAGADLHHRDRDGHTAFTLAAANGHVGIVNALFAYNPGPHSNAEWIIKLQNEADNEARTGLMLAALNRQRETLLVLIKSGAEVLKKDCKGRDAMWWAAAKGGQAIASLLQSNKANLFVADMNGNTLFHAAAEYGARDVIEMYCGTTYADSPLNINVPNKDGDTPLILAARHGHLEVVNFLLSEKANFLHENKHGQTALHEAGAYGFEDIYTLLAEKEEKLVKVYSFVDNVREDIVKVLPFANSLFPARQEPGSRPADRNGNTPAHRAAANGRTSILGKMLAERAQPMEGRLAIMQSPPDGLPGPLVRASSTTATTRSWIPHLEILNAEGLTTLCMAIRPGNFNTVKRLVMEGSNVNFVNSDGVTPLWLACRRREFDTQRDMHPATSFSGETPADLVQLLLDYGALADAPSFCGQTPLGAASATGDVAIVRCLIRAGAKVNHVDDNGLTALMLASHFGHSGIVAILLDAGAAPNPKPNPVHGKLSALLLAAESGRDQVVQLLIERGAQKDRKHDDGATALTVASAAGNESTVALLIGLGANLYIQDKYGKTAMDYAKRGNHYKIVMLLEAGYSMPRDC